MKAKKLLSVLLSLMLVLALVCACSGNGTPAVDTQTPVPETTPAQSAEAPAAEVNLGLLKGPTGMGAARLLADNDAGETAAHYNVTLGADPANDIVPRVINGELDLAAVPTNLAATLFNKTGGGVKLLALNTLGVLHILENGESVNTVADLAGRTLYATGQGANPEYVLNYLLKQNGLTPGEDVTIEWKASDELVTLMAAGEVELCMLPVPAATSVMMQNADVRDAIDLNDAWSDADTSGIFTMGCLIARTEWLEENGALVDGILDEYKASIQYAIEHVDEAAELMAQYEIVPKAAVARAAIPQAGMVYVDGEDLLDVSGYYEVLFAADPTSIGGSVPDDSFYYIP